MAQLKNKGITHILAVIFGLVLGLLAGAASICIMASYRIDLLYEKIMSLENTIADKDAKLENLEKSINSKKFVLKDIEVILSYKESEIDEIERMHIEKTVKEKYCSLLGNEVKSIDPDICIIVVDNRILKMNGKEFQLHVNKLILAEVLKLWIEVEAIG